MSSIVEKLKSKLTTSDDSQAGGNPQAAGATADPRGHDASKLPFSTKEGENQQKFPGEVQGSLPMITQDVDLARCRAFGQSVISPVSHSYGSIFRITHTTCVIILL